MPHSTTSKRHHSKMMLSSRRRRTSNSLVLLFLLITSCFTSTTTAQDVDVDQIITDNETPNEVTEVETAIASSTCGMHPKIQWDPQNNSSAIKKNHYTVGVLAIRGPEAAYQEFNSTWNTYLTATAGQRFDPPLSFDMRPLNFKSLFTDTESAAVDFIYVNPSAYSCMESEYTAHSLASQISRRNIHGNIYDLQMFGGVIMARADNTEVNHIQDIQGKRVAAASISGLGSGQMQFLELQKAGMSYINDPGQLVFTSNQGKVVNGVLKGDFDVGFVRTDQIERTKGANGELLDPALFKIIDPVSDLKIGDMDFPFASSTPLYPEWNIAALSHVPDVVQRAVQRSMLNLGDHAHVQAELDLCLVEAMTNNVTDPESICKFEDMPKLRCDTTPELAQIATTARNNGKYVSWSPTLSYMQLRSMQEVTGFIAMDPADNTWKCTRSTTLYDSIVCPAGYYKATEQQVSEGCPAAGFLDCAETDETYQCLCSPCIKITECENGVTIGDNKCAPYRIFLPAVLIPIFLLLALIVHFYVEYKRRQADAVWTVDPEEIHFDTPLQVIGRGTFGYVLLAEYRGTKVAVKKVLPPRSAMNKKGKKGNKRQSGTALTSDWDPDDDVESQSETNPALMTVRPHITGSASIDDEFRNKIFGSHQNPGLRSMAARLTSMTNSVGTGSICQPNHEQLKKDFIREMRHLSKLRHPCITTVMGAVISAKTEPMLVMEYMTQGSLHDVLMNKSIHLDVDEHVLPILQDIAQGMRFLHSASPLVVHGDLKSKNVLIDNNFRAKVTDFGLSSKRQNQATGTPFWMAPELLHGNSTNTAKSDIYSFGILLYEVYSREIPYQGDNYLEVLKQVCDPVIQKRPHIPHGCSYKVGELYMNCISHDPSRRPTAEVVDLALRVEGSVKERTTRLEKLNQDLEEANKKIALASEMQLEHFACMSHEIRTPLNCVVGIASLMDETNLDQSQKESINMISSSSRLLQSIVDDVLDYSKLQSGNAEVDIKECDIQRVVKDLVSSMRASVIARRRNISIETRFDPLVSQHIQSDGRRLLQILFNLVSNAVKFSKTDGVVKVRIFVASKEDKQPQNEGEIDEETGERHVPTVKFMKKVLRLTVKDFGKGIEEKNFDTIFQPFTQTMSGVKNIEGGTGLGLAITEKLVKALGGEIAVDSCLSQWTEFTVDLPYEEPEPPLTTYSVTKQFKNVDVFVIGNGQAPPAEEGNTCNNVKYLDEILQTFQVDAVRVPTMEELEAMLLDPKNQEAQNEERRGLVCIVPAHLVDERISHHLAHLDLYALKTVVVGPKEGLPKDAPYLKHFTSLGETIPQIFMNGVAGLGKASLETTRNAAGLQLPIDKSDRTYNEDGYTSGGSNHSSRSFSKPKPKQPFDLTTLKILCAEDNTVNQKILVRMLKRLGIQEIKMVENGKLAVEEEAQTQYDVVLMDMQMPVMDGIDATKLILQRDDENKGSHKKPLVVFVTAHVSASFEQQCLDCGATSYLPKPYTLPVLKETLLQVGDKIEELAEQHTLTIDDCDSDIDEDGGID